MPAEDMAKPKTIQYRFVEEGEGTNRHQLYRLMDELIAQHHPDLVEFKIGIFYRKGFKPDKDGKLILGQARKASEIERQIHNYHAMIVLNEEWWNDPGTNSAQKRAIMDHELCHLKADKDANEDVKRDEQGGPCLRMAKHDLEEFEEIVSRHGLYTQNLQRMAAAMYNARNENNNRRANDTEEDALEER